MKTLAIIILLLVAGYYLIVKPGRKAKEANDRIIDRYVSKKPKR